MKFKKVVKEEYAENPHIYYRGYDSRYGVLDSEYSQLYTWLTSEISYASQYTENNKFGKIARVKITCSDKEIGSVYNLPEEVDYYDPGDEAFKEYILDEGLKGYWFDAGEDYKCICILKNCVQIIDPDVKYYEEEED